MFMFTVSSFLEMPVDIPTSYELQADAWLKGNPYPGGAGPGALLIIPEISPVTTGILNEPALFCRGSSGAAAPVRRRAVRNRPGWTFSGKYGMIEKKSEAGGIDKKLTRLTPDCNFFVIWKGRNPWGPQV
ncbi:MULTISPECIES: hypothetical protein [Oscillospiraceae]|jgi:hypothetical protein|uniref:hypothetical protein n=2 Tax=Dysosmobacter welbionis TaxID=2093857 RepID=UPI000E656A01